MTSEMEEPNMTSSTLSVSSQDVEDYFQFTLEMRNMSMEVKQPLHKKLQTRKQK